MKTIAILFMSIILALCTEVAYRRIEVNELKTKIENCNKTVYVIMGLSNKISSQRHKEEVKFKACKEVLKKHECGHGSDENHIMNEINKEIPKVEAIMRANAKG